MTERSDYSIYHSAIFLIFLLLLQLQILSIYEIGNSGFRLKYGHAFSLALLPPLLIGFKYLRFPWQLGGLLAFILIHTTIAYSIYNFNYTLVKFIFSAYCLLLGFYFQKKLGYFSCLKIFRIISFIMIVAVLIKVAIYWSAFFEGVVGRQWKPQILLYYGGGPNLESTFIALSSLFFLRTKFYYYMVSATLLISILYVSRTATVVSFITLIYPILGILKKRSYDRLIVAGAVISIVGYIALRFLAGKYIIYRFERLTEGLEALSGREEIWAFVLGEFLENPLGYGLGNGIIPIKESLMEFRTESNLHNVGMQMLLDLGFIGGLIYLFSVYKLITGEFRSGFTNEVGGYLLLALAASQVQFTGYESYIWFVVGVYISMRKFNGNWRIRPVHQ